MRPCYRVMAVLAGTIGLAGCGAIDEQAEREFVKGLGHTTVTVFPAVVRAAQGATYDNDAAREIAGMLTAEKLGGVTIAAEHVELSRERSVNQAKMFRLSMEMFGEYVRLHGVTTDYALVAEYLVMGDGRAGGVHCYIVRKDGTGAFGRLLNSHHRLFRQIHPRGAADCRRLVVEDLAAALNERRARPETARRAQRPPNS